jgi:uncharacterized SAM-binding protein YcdF (DUF218 family)
MSALPISALLGYLAGALASPSLLCALAALAGLVLLLATRWQRLARALLVLGIVPPLLVLLLPLGDLAALPLEQRYPRPPALPSHVDGIIVLGGAVRPWIFEDRGTPGLNEEAERMTEAAALAHAHPTARLVFTGGVGWRSRGGITESDAARLFFAGAGLAGRVEFEDRSDTTWENALLSRRRAAPRPGETWVLVTSAIHMPRAVAAFAAVDWPVLPWPVAYRTRRSLNWVPGVNLPGRMRVLDIAVHEWVGMLVYRLRGRAA